MYAGLRPVHRRYLVLPGPRHSWSRGPAASRVGRPRRGGRRWRWCATASKVHGTCHVVCHDGLHLGADDRPDLGQGILRSRRRSIFSVFGVRLLDHSGGSPAHPSRPWRPKTHPCFAAPHRCSIVEIVQIRPAIGHTLCGLINVLPGPPDSSDKSSRTQRVRRMSPPWSCHRFLWERPSPATRGW